MTNRSELQLAFRAAFPATIPILAGFLFLGIAYGIFMNISGFGAGYAFLMSLLIFAGSMEFVAVHLLLGAFNPLGAFFLALMVNARHLFYGISMLEKFKGSGLKKIYLIFGMCDETFSINYTAQIPQGVNKGWYMFFVTLLNHIYWVLGATIGGLFGSLVQINMEGLEFVMTALFVVIFIEQWLKETTHHSALLGLGLSVLCLFIFNGDNFIIPSMILILCVLTLMRRPLEKKTGETT
ncbi:MAG: azaleucine resistance protein AzlC [Paenibacillus macerans]|uniref:Azaleucine resistance protein AzlC n=1 Tax=Paenibacillus macerans TaxID=44252 RepID=A0A090ZS86_PAEMA|nr:azaleucine resistance protein AzlC [Paenibacillus macerans]KFN06986.1 azaleucine resistance protein AzlC [Paenibacillus macerans]MBS5910557.1 azaleucine resistance protein AzlC [Paenibacillus macerans]MCY7560637.1 azaleucine resistance protein AzlC [Paenibacillus macerans]MDU5946464.1 azaleucine resistance protein AzlC [Paenibacillus macerans]MDU7473699.1 azaleucine resistance protein AzlC [Paenibacillus macerans]